MAANDADDVRAVLAELASLSFTFRTAAGIATRTHLPLAFIDGVLRQFGQVGENNPYRVWTCRREGKEVFTLESQRLNRLRSLAGIRQIGDWLEAPAIG